MNYYNWNEIRSHNKKNDCWLVVGHKVYDATEFLKLHPNHSNRILSKAGTDVKSDFDFHTKNQKKLWKNYFIGYVENNHKICVIC